MCKNFPIEGRGIRKNFISSSPSSSENREKVFGFFINCRKEQQFLLSDFGTIVVSVLFSDSESTASENLFSKLHVR